MSVELSSEMAKRPVAFDAIFSDLPPLGSAEYLGLLEKAPVSALPPQVVARAFRELIRAGEAAAADATLIRLVANPKFDYLGLVRKLSHGHFVKGSYSYGPDDLVQETIVEIVRTLPTTRGEIAESAWVLFIKHRFEDARRSLYGRFGQKDPEGRVEPYIDHETGEEVDPVEHTDGSSAEWHVGAHESDLPWLIEFNLRTAAKIADPLIRYVALDQFGGDPSPISAGRSEGGKPPFTEQLGLHRSKISRALRAAKARLKAELMTQNEREIDLDWLGRFTD